MEAERNLKHNWIFNVLDGAFFGFGMGFASFVTILPLFVSNLTDSAMLIGLIPAIHNAGWHLPQLLLANRTSRQRKYKPLVLLMTLHERAPFLGFALVAWFLPVLGTQLALVLTFGLLIWQGLGAGLTANPWLSMIARVFPANRRGTFFGSQSAAANLMGSLSAVLAGIILDRLVSPYDFSLSFFLTGVCMLASLFFLAQTREVERVPVNLPPGLNHMWGGLKTILKTDANFRWYMALRMTSQLAAMGFSFYTVYAVRQHGASEAGVGLMTGVYLGVQITANPILGWIGDRWSHRTSMMIGVSASIFSGVCAWLGASPAWFYLAFFLAGVANVAFWTTGLAMLQEFGSEDSRPAYIGLANTLITPSTILAPLLGGWLADSQGYPAAFVASITGGIITLLILALFLRDTRQPAAEVSAIDLQPSPEETML